MATNNDKNTTDHCLICSNRVGVSPRNSIRIFDDSNETTGKKKLIDTINNILEENINEENSHSNLLCKKCYKLFTEFESLESRLLEIKEEINLNYKMTLKELNINTSIQIEEEYNDHDYIDNSMEYQIDDDKKSEYIEEERIDEESYVEFSPVNQVSEDDHIRDVEYLNDDDDDDDGEEDDNNNDDNDGNDDEYQNDSVDDQAAGIVLQIVQNHDDSSNNSCILPDNNKTVGQISVIETSKLLKNSKLKNNNNKKKKNKKKILSAIEYSDKPIVSKIDTNYHCLLCPDDTNKFITDAKNMIIHMREVHDLRLYICDVCGIDFRKRNELNSHMDAHVDDEKGDFQCEKCNRIFHNLRLFRVHKRSHNPQNKSWKCDKCDKRFGSKNLLTEHMNTHSGKRPYKCNICEKDFASKYTFKAHEKTHEVRARPFDCKECTKTFLSQQNLNQHIKTHLGVKEYICKDCNKAFGSAHNLEVHTIIHSGHKPFECELCGKAFARKAEKRDHERTHTGEKPYQCETCGSRFSQRSNLQSHKRATHLNDKRYTCDECGKGFKRRRLLDYHIKAAHTGERPFECEECDARFVYPEHYKKHKRTHTGEKPYKCEYCNKAFGSRDNRNAHRFIHSSKKPYECSTCGQGYMRKPQLEQHMKDENHLSDKIITNEPVFPPINNQEVILPEGIEYLSENENQIISDGQIFKLEVIQPSDEIYETEDNFVDVNQQNNVQHIIVNNTELEFENVIETKPSIETTNIYNYEETQNNEEQIEESETIIDVPTTTTNEYKNILVDETVQLIQVNVSNNENNHWVSLVPQQT